MIDGITKSGIAFSIDEDALDNMELIDALSELQGGNVVAVSRVSALLFGEEGKLRLYEQIRKKYNGRVPTSAFVDVITETFEALGPEGKK